MKNITFSKMNGSGNDFILIDNFDGSINTDVAELAKSLCRRKFSIGADGLILIEKSENADFRWQFYNADGSEAEMCGNGARCAAKFSVRQNLAGDQLSFETGAGIIHASVKGIDGQVKVELTNPVDLRKDLDVSIDEQTCRLTHINTGVPHTVMIVQDIERADVVGLGRKIRFHELFQPDGTNANFVTILSEHNISVRTYERGVEDETLACGTGAVASALATSLTGKVKSPISVLTRGEELLNVYFNRDGDTFRDVFLEGDTTFVYEGKV